MFCTACATPNSVLENRCAACGSELSRVRRWHARRSVARRVVSWALYVVPILVLLAVGFDRYAAARSEQAVWYARGDAAVALGQYDEAVAAFAAAGDHEDAVERLAAANADLAPYHAAYQSGVAALNAADYEEAIAALSTVVRDLPHYEDTAILLAQARQGWETDLLDQADTAFAAGDWLAAERLLATLAAHDPANRELADRLADLRRTGAPLVFTRDHDLYLVRPDLTGERLLTDDIYAAWPVWSPDRTQIAFTGMGPEGFRGGIHLFVIDADGSNLTEVAGGLRDYSPPVWSPDGTRIAYTSEGENTSRPERASRTVRMVDVATGRETNLTGQLVPNANLPSWSPTGDRIAFVQRSEIGPDDGGVYVLSLETGELTNVGAGRIPFPWRVVWSPADDRLLVYTREPGMSFEADRVNLYLLDLSSGALVDVNRGNHRITPPVWSPDGSRFAYVEEGTVVRVRSSSGQSEHRLDLGINVSGFLAWSPDGSALIAPAASPWGESYLVPLDGNDDAPIPLRLDHDTQRRQSGAPQWSALNPAAVAAPPTVAGTALDPDLPAGGAVQPPPYQGPDWGRGGA